MREELEVYPHHNWNAAVVFRRAVPPSPFRRTDAWYRDVTASAIAIARWEDDGGRPARVSVSGASPRSSGGRMPRGDRDI
jgi:hypothetical protein